MAVPVLRGVTAPAISSGAVSSPASTQVGDLLIFLVWSQGAVIPDHAIQSGFFEWRTHSHNDGSTDGRLSVAVKEAALSGTQSYTPYVITNATANQTSIGVVVLQAGTWNPAYAESQPRANSATQTNNAVPNPPSLADLTGDFYVLALAGWHVTSAAAVAATTMANYSIIAQNASASHVTHLAIAARSMTGLSAATEDPGAFGDNVAPNGSASMTIAVPGVVEHTSGALDASGAGDLVVASSVRGATSGALEASGAGAVDVDGAVTGGGPTEHMSGAIESAGAGSVDVMLSVRGTSSGALELVGTSSIAVAAVRDTFSGAVAAAGASSLAVAAAIRATTSGALLLSGASAIAVDGIASGQGPQEHTSGALSMNDAGDLVVASSTVVFWWQRQRWTCSPMNWNRARCYRALADGKVWQAANLATRMRVRVCIARRIMGSLVATGHAMRAANGGVYR
jgi:hypothetical protein